MSLVGVISEKKKYTPKVETKKVTHLKLKVFLGVVMIRIEPKSKYDLNELNRPRLSMKSNSQLNRFSEVKDLHAD